MSSQMTVNEKDLVEINELEFTPNEQMRVVKARFWEALKDNPLLLPENITLDAAVRMTNCASLRNWMQKVEFRLWFLNENLAKHKIMAAAEAAVEKLMDIIGNETTDKNANAQVKAAQILLEYAGFAPAKHKVIEFKDKEVGNMSETELRDYIKKLNKQLKVD